MGVAVSLKRRKRILESVVLPELEAPLAGSGQGSGGARGERVASSGDQRSSPHSDGTGRAAEDGWQRTRRR